VAGQISTKELVSRSKYLNLPTAVIIAIGLGTALLLGSILVSPYLYDDLINKDIRAVSSAQGVGLGDQILYYTLQWISSEGRFFPGSLAWSFSVFWFFGNHLAYKLLVGLVSISSIGVFSTLIATTTRNRALGALTWLVLLLTCQVRFWFDGLSAFAGLVPLTVLLVSGSLLILVKTRSIWLAIVAGLLLLFALVTYEVVIVFVPVAVALIWATSKSWRRCLPILIPSVLIALASLWLRILASGQSTGPAYSISLDPGALATTLAKQVLAAVPFSQWIFSQNAPEEFSKTVGLLVGLCLFVPALLGIRGLISILASKPLSRRVSWSLLGAGAWVWISAAMMVAISVRWQAELALGQGYLSVVYEYFGVAMVLVALISLFARFSSDSRLTPVPKNFLAWAMSTGLALAICVSLAASLSVANA
jgi:hypothetical protein